MRPSIRPSDQAEASKLRTKIGQHQARCRPLPGINTPGHLDCILAQLIDSKRRVKYAKTITAIQHDQTVKDPRNIAFNPLKAAVLHSRSGNHDEACWLVFLATHFGKHISDGWNLTKAVYGRLGAGPNWDWATTSQNVAAFRTWISQNEKALRRFRFSNHRKYESIVSAHGKGLADVVESYVNWIGPPGTHSDFVRAAHKIIGQNPKDVFDYIYRSMDAVKRFGRLGKFDYLTMLDKLQLAPIEPGTAYLAEATGPLFGARLLFGGSTTSNLRAITLESYLVDLDHDLQVGMQVLEDSLCNWQKSPLTYVYFTG